MTVTRRGDGESPGGYERRRSEVRRTDRRWLITLVFLVVVASFGGYRLSSQQSTISRAQQHIIEVERESVRNCELLNDAHRKFNGLLDFTIDNTVKSQQLTEAEKTARVKQYAAFHLIILHCPVV